MKKEINRLDHSKKIFSLTNWNIFKEIIGNNRNDIFSPILTLDLTEKCNYYCKYCIDEKNKNKSKALSIEWTFLKRILPEIKALGCQCIEITGGGEPTQYEHFEDFINLSDSLGFKMSLITNGSLLYKYEKLLMDKSIDWIRVSIDASNEETHKKVHSIYYSYFPEIINTVKKISVKRVIGFSFVVCKDNYTEIFESAKLAKESGAKYIEYKPLIVNGKFYSQFNLDFIVNQIEKSKKIQDETFSVIITDSFKRILSLKDENDDKPYNICYACFFRTLLTPSGVYLCSYNRGNQGKKVKSINSAIDIISARNELIFNTDPRECCIGYCARNEFNKVIDDLFKITKEYPATLDYFGWPVDYGEDWMWL